jgi:hypothetical protein
MVLYAFSMLVYMRVQLPYWLPLDTPLMIYRFADGPHDGAALRLDPDIELVSIPVYHYEDYGHEVQRIQAYSVYERRECCEHFHFHGLNEHPMGHLVVEHVPCLPFRYN